MTAETLVRVGDPRTWLLALFADHPMTRDGGTLVACDYRNKRIHLPVYTLSVASQKRLRTNRTVLDLSNHGLP